MRRPLSPHLQIYRVQMTSGLSALHRISGLILVGLWIKVMIYLCLAIVQPAWAELIRQYAKGWPILVLVSVYGVAFIYHMLNGFRHILWDMGWGFEMPQVNKTGQFVLVGTLCLGAAWLLHVWADCTCLKGMGL